MKQFTQDKPAPDHALYAGVRAAFTARHSSLCAWCREHGEHRQSATRALLGKSRGPMALELRARLIEASGYQQEDRSQRRRARP